MSKYAELLKDPRWQRVRLLVLELDGWKCSRCRDYEATLHVHHTFYERGRKPWEYHPDSLVALCDTCHEKESAGVEMLPSVRPRCTREEAIEGGRLAMMWADARHRGDRDGVELAGAAMADHGKKIEARVRQSYKPEWAWMWPEPGDLPL